MGCIVYLLLSAKRPYFIVLVPFLPIKKRVHFNMPVILLCISNLKSAIFSIAVPNRLHFIIPVI